MSKRILVVEDQPDNRQIIRDMLAPTDYEITEAENGEQALKFFFVRVDPFPQDFTPRASLRTRVALHAHDIGRKPMAIATAAAATMV